MKNKFNLSVICIVLLTSCSDFLDKSPISEVTPEQYLSTEQNIAAYAICRYGTLPTHEGSDYGTFVIDANTDNQISMTPSTIYAPGYYQVPQSGGAWDFTNIYHCNYFFDMVLPKYERGEISGNLDNIKHYIGEMYFFRAFAYFAKLKALGDFPIVTKTYPDEINILTDISKRAPRNEVARFILSDLDKAIEFMLDKAPVGGKNRLNKYCAILFKSRVALFEGTWLKYFKNTAFVPNGPDWPGKLKEYNQNYSYPLGDIDKEIDYFLGVSMEASKIIADKFELVPNTGVYQENPEDPENKYFNMFSDTNMEGYSEVLLWRQYNQNVTNNVASHASRGNNGTGISKSMVDAFIMSNGEPIYASGSYPGDQLLDSITKGRDTRASLFIKTPGRRNLHTDPGTHGAAVEPLPKITATSNEERYTTGYAMCKGLNFDGKYTNLNKSEVGSIIFRAVEAYLNYMEACYEKNQVLDEYAKNYWKKIRERAKVSEDFQHTIDLTDMAKEGETDWGAYSAGNLIDATLYNIRRERRCELMGEGLRMMDLKRWRAMDQMITTPYHPLGINLWDEMYKILSKEMDLKEGENVSPKSFNKYLAPYHILDSNIAFNGYRWNLAHYLEPIAIRHISITSGGDLENSPIYQNPGWTLVAGSGPN